MYRCYIIVKFTLIEFKYIYKLKALLHMCCLLSIILLCKLPHRTAQALIE